MTAEERQLRCLRACMRHIDVEGVRRYVQLGGDVTAVHRGSTLMHAAARNGSVEVARELVNAGAQLDSLDCRGCSPAHVAACHKQHAILCYLLELLCKEDQEQRSRQLTPFWCWVLAIRANHTKCAGALVESGLSVTVGALPSPRLAQVYENYVPLILQVLFMEGPLSLAETLVKAGLKPCAISLPLDVCIHIQGKDKCLQFFQLLLEAGFKLNLRLKESQSNLASKPAYRDFHLLLTTYSPNLQCLARTVIRNSMASNPIVTHISNKIEELPLARHVKAFLRLE